MLVTGRWNQNTESDLLGYKLYSGRSSGNYTEVVVITDFLTTVESLYPDGVLMYFALTSFDVTGNESAKSTEVTKINKYTNFAM